MDSIQKYGEIEIDFDLLKKDKLVVGYNIYSDNSNINRHLEKLDFAKKNYCKLYNRFLEELFSWQERFDFEVWNEDDATFSPIHFNKKEEMHQYLGEPIIEILEKNEKLYIGITFWKNNRLSIEHGLSAIYEDDKLIRLDCDDCPNMVYWLDVEG